MVFYVFLSFHIACLNLQMFSMFSHCFQSFNGFVVGGGGGGGGMGGWGGAITHLLVFSITFFVSNTFQYFNLFLNALCVSICCDTFHFSSKAFSNNFQYVQCFLLYFSNGL